MPTAAIATFGAGRVDPLKYDEGTVVENVNLVSSITYAAGTLIGETATPGVYGKYASVVNANRVTEVQLITVNGGPTGGFFTLEFNDQETTPLATSASTPTAAAVQAALVALSTIGAGGVIVSGSNGGPFTVTFAAGLLYGPQPLIGVSSALTGGTTPTVTVTEVTPGNSGAPTDGTQNWTHILQYPCVTDASGNVFIGTTATSEWGQSQKGAPAYRGGEFSCADIPNLDANALLNRGKLLQGTVTAGRVVLYGR